MEDSSNLKSILLKANSITKERAQRHDKLMKACVKKKLDNALEVYQSELEDTCRYIMIRNPLVITKEMHQARIDSERGRNKND